MYERSVPRAWRIGALALSLATFIAAASAAEAVQSLTQPSAWTAQQGISITRTTESLVFADTGIGERCAYTDPLKFGPTSALVLVVDKMSVGAIKVQLYFRDSDGRLLAEGAVRANETVITEPGLYLLPLAPRAPPGAVSVAGKLWSELSTGSVSFSWIGVAARP